MKVCKSPQPLFEKEGSIQIPPSTKGVRGIWFFHYNTNLSTLVWLGVLDGLRIELQEFIFLEFSFADQLQ